MKIEPGQQVRINKTHWARARQTGVIVEILENGRFIVEFAREGVGFEEGRKLILGQEDLENEAR